MRWLASSGSTTRTLNASGAERHYIRFPSAAHALLTMAPWLPTTEAADGTSILVPYAAVAPLGWAMLLYNPDWWSASPMLDDSILSPIAIDEALAAAIAAGLPTSAYGSCGQMIVALHAFALSHSDTSELWLSSTMVETVDRNDAFMREGDPYNFLPDIRLHEMALGSGSMAVMALFEVLPAPRLMSANSFKADHRMIANAKSIYDIFADAQGPIKCGMDVGATLERIRRMQRCALTVLINEHADKRQYIEIMFDGNAEKGTPRMLAETNNALTTGP